MSIEDVNHSYNKYTERVVSAERAMPVAEQRRCVTEAVMQD